MRIIDRIDFRKFMAKPKWIIGYSDITVLHAHVHRHFAVETLHATMPVNMKDDAPAESLESLRNVLFGSRISYTLPLAPLNRPGEGEGQLVGGNLSVLYSIMGSESMPDTAGKILFLEDVDEYLYHVDRMMIALKRAGMLDRLKGFIVGGMDRMNDNAVPFGKNAYRIVAEAADGGDYPVCFGFPAGHGAKNLALIMGRTVRLRIDKRVEIMFS